MVSPAEKRAQARTGLKGKTPEQTLAAQLGVNAKRGRYVERTEPGAFRLERDRSRYFVTRRPA